MTKPRCLRFEVLRRDNHACRYCGAVAPDEKLTIDHVIPVALGGDDKASNLVTACAACNSGKSSMSPDAPIVEGVSDDALRWARAMVAAAELQEASRVDEEAYRQAFNDAWSSWYYEGDPANTCHLPADWRPSIDRFNSLGLEFPILKDAVDIAMTAYRIPDQKRFAYFCGVVWTKYRQRQELAAELVAAGLESER